MRKNLLIICLWIPTTLITLVTASLLLINVQKIRIASIIKEDNKLQLGVNEYQLFASVPEVLGTLTSDVKTGDARPEILRNFFESNKSPLVPYSKYFVDVADTFNLDFRLLPAIAMQESNLCKKIPENSYNCWGYGIYGDKITKFKSYEEGIEIVAESLREKYVDKGFLSAEEIMSKYTPSSNGSWAKAVNHFMEEMK